ncbi:MAG TPA: hypothetical protein V6D17_12025 [Candidatus Obscuribacterales bacterium]
MKRSVFLVTLIILAIGVLAYWFRHRENEIWLSLYVDSSLEDAALKCQDGWSIEALKLVNNVEDHTPRIWEEKRYIKALCLQSMGRFKESFEEFESLEDARGLWLEGKAKIGAERARHHQRQLSHEQLHFPAWMPSAR